MATVMVVVVEILVLVVVLVLVLILGTELLLHISAYIAR